MERTSLSLAESAEDFNPPGILLVLSGIPGSGKTTFAKKLVSQRRQYRIEHLCFDTELAALIGDNDTQRTTMKQARIELQGQVEARMRQYKESRFFIWILDDTMYYPSMRKPYYQLCCKYHWCYLHVKIRSSVETCLERNATRQGTRSYIATETIHKMHRVLTSSDRSDVTWENSCIMIVDSEKHGSSTSDVLRKVEVLRSSQKHFKSAKTENTKTTACSLLSLIDLRLRSLVGEVMKTNSKKISSRVEKARLAAAAQLVKTRLQHEYRHRSVSNEDDDINSILVQVDARFKEEILKIIV